MHSKAWDFAVEYHYGQKYGDRDYIDHLIAVEDSALTAYGDNVFTYKELHRNASYVSLLHDILEDTGCTEEELRENFSTEVVDAVVAITKVDGETYEDYLKKVRANELALHVKIHDTLCNLTESVRKMETKRIKKYSQQLILLTEVVND